MGLNRCFGLITLALLILLGIPMVLGAAEVTSDKSGGEEDEAKPPKTIAELTEESDRHDGLFVLFQDRKTGKIKMLGLARCPHHPLSPLTVDKGGLTVPFQPCFARGLAGCQPPSVRFGGWAHKETGGWGWCGRFPDRGAWLRRPVSQAALTFRDGSQILVCAASPTIWELTFRIVPA